MLVARQRVDFLGLDAEHHSVQLRTPELRLLWIDTRNVATDYGLLQQASPFTHRFTRSGATVIFEGEGRFEEAGRRAYFGPGDVVQSDHRRRGTEAYAGARGSYLVVEWAPSVHGAAIREAFSIGRLPVADLARLRAARHGLSNANAPEVAAEVFAMLRAAGVPLEPLDPRQLRDDDEAERALTEVVEEHLGRLAAFPSIEDVADRLGWTQRTVHRRLTAYAERYQVSFQHWRDAVRQARLIHALRLLSVRGTTTELVAKACGFRSPAALCHAFADAGLPSPGKVAGAARREVLSRWSEIADAMARDRSPTSHRAA